MRYLLVLTLSIGLLSLGCQQKKAEPTATPPMTAGPTDFMTGIPAATAPAIDTPTPTPTPVVTPRPIPTPNGVRNYTVQKGDNLTAIARTQLGDPRRINEILALNPDLSRDKILPVGKVIKLPEK